jgi:hypothetical protein
MKTLVIDNLKYAEIYKNHFLLYQVIYGKMKEHTLNFVIPEYSSLFNLNDIKRQTDLIDFLYNHNMKMTEHVWKPDDWNTSVVGFIPQYAPTYYTKEYVRQKMNVLVQSTKNVPEFQVKTVKVSSEVLGKRLHWKYPSR